jgi:hypothetical protein
LSWGDFASGAVRAIVRHGLGTQLPSSFLGRVLAAWYAGQQTREQRMYRLALVCFHRRQWFALDYRFTRDIECALRRTYALHVHADFWIAADWPAVERDERQRPHRTDAPAIHWRDGTGIPYLHGVQVTRDIMEGRFTFADILNTPNAELRRTMIELYERDDRGRFLRDADAETLHWDYDRLGHKQRLLRVDLPGDEPYVGVEVINSTPEPDGSHRRYILRVPPETTTCRAGIAWTFGLTEREYEPDAET